MKKRMLKQFSNPGCEYRGAPFWAWNGKLEPEELRRQVRVMKEMGLGGFFMHSRVGLDTVYLSDEWFECIKACIDEAEKLDMKAWLYDEDRWPSGAAGGIVTKNHAYRAKKLILEELPSTADFKWGKATLAVFAGKIKDSNASDLRRLSRTDLKIGKDETLLHFYVQINGDSSWYNNQAYLDLLDKRAVKEFIRVTHERYRKEVGEQFGKRVPGIFTDEPNHNSVGQNISSTNTAYPWSRDLRNIFLKRYGYDLLERLPEIFFQVDGKPISQAKFHYHDCVTSMFVDAFIKQIGDWCDKNNIEHTGHLLLEDSLSSQTSVVGSCMRSYEYMQAPGMDLLTEHSDIYDTAKQVSSAARQFDRKWRLTETYGCTGWDFPFLGHKALGDWQAALGINLRCQHLSWYTMLGEAKRDYPAGIFYQSPWWQQYSKVEDYFGRINVVMTQGKEVRDLLVIHPVESMWPLAIKQWRQMPETRKLDKMFVDVRNSLLQANIDFDYGDEDILSRHTSIIEGKEPKFKVAKASYKAIIVPELITMRSSTLKLLKDFHQAGGKVIFAGKPAEYVDALPSEEVANFAKACVKVPSKGPKLAEAAECCRRISIQDKTGKEIDNTLYLLREDRDNFYLFFCNTGYSPAQKKKIAKGGNSPRVVKRTRSYEKVTVKGFAGCAGEPMELNPDTGEIYKIAAKTKKGMLNIQTSLPALSSKLYVIPKKKSKVKYPLLPQIKNVRKQTLGNKIWKVLYSEDNVLVLDYPHFRINGGKWQQDEVLQVDYKVRDSLGIQRRGGRMVQPWAREKKQNLKSLDLDLKYVFSISEIPQSTVYLAIEKIETFSIAINGNRLDSDNECGWWVDHSLRKIAIDPSILKKGENVITMQCAYNENHPGLEIVYLLGAFGVKMRKKNVNEMTALPAKLKIGDWTKQGLPFYSGAVSYCRNTKVDFSKKEKVSVAIPEYNGAAVRVTIDGTEAGMIAWEPNELDITDLITSKQTFELKIEVISHRRNSHGPLHNPETWPRWTGPGQFNDPAAPYNLVSCGLKAAPSLLVTKY